MPYENYEKIFNTFIRWAPLRRACSPMTKRCSGSRSARRGTGNSCEILDSKTRLNYNKTMVGGAAVPCPPLPSPSPPPFSSWDTIHEKSIRSSFPPEACRAGHGRLVGPAYLSQPEHPPCRQCRQQGALRDRRLRRARRLALGRYVRAKTSWPWSTWMTRTLPPSKRR